MKVAHYKDARPKNTDQTPTKHLPIGQIHLSNLYKRLPTGRLCRDTNKRRDMHSINQMYRIRAAMRRSMTLSPNGYTPNDIEVVLDYLDEALNLPLPDEADEVDKGETYV